MINDGLDIKRKLVKALVRLQASQPFIGYLGMNFKFVEFPKESNIQTMGVDVNFNLYYSEKFIDEEINNYDVLVGCCAHEILHIALNHIGRIGDRIPEICNIAQDMVVWYMVKECGMQILSGEKYINVSITNNFGWFTLFSSDGMPIKRITVNNLKDKCWEKVYDEIINQMDPKDYESSSSSFDKHMHESFNNMTKTEQDKYVQNLRQKLSDAYVQNIGNLPGGMERYINEFLKSKISWKSKILKNIKRSIEPVDYHYRKPHRKSYQLEIYLPGINKEKIETDIVVDLSGSIDLKSYTEFISEIYGLIKSFPVIECNIYFGDTTITSKHNIKKSNIKDLMILKPKGGGGTDMEAIFKEISETRKHSKLVICLTDGYTHVSNTNKFPFNVIWVLCKSSRAYNNFSYGEVIKMED